MSFEELNTFFAVIGIKAWSLRQAAIAASSAVTAANQGQ
jgi:hypothetical protein